MGISTEGEVTVKSLKTLLAVVSILVAVDSNESIADHVVLQAVSESYTEGELLHDPITIRLGEGERVVLMSDLGDIIDIDGPFSGEPSGSDADEFDLKTALSSLIENADNIHASLGSTRGGGIRLGQTDVRPMWTLDPLRSGAQCVLERSEAVFWRADSTDRQELIIQRPGFDGAGTIVWKRGESRARWPVTVSIVHGELYVIRREGWMESALVYLAVLPATVAINRETTTAWLAANGCKVQAEAMMRSIDSQDAADKVDK